MPTSSGHEHSHRADLPEVERPSFHIWQPLEAESIQFEGQVLIVGGAADMPALLVITSQRLVLISNGHITLDFPRAWLRPQPKLAAENGIRLFINPEGNDGDPHPVLLRAREGRGAAMEVVGILTGRPLPVAQPSTGIRIPNWKETVGAARPVALPSLSDTSEDASRPATKSFWPPQETAAVKPEPSQKASTTTRTRPASSERPMQTLADRRRTIPDPTPVPASVSRAARKQGTLADGVTVREDSGWQEAHFTSTTHKKRGAGAWLMTAAIMLLLLGGIGYVVQDRYNLTIDDVRARIPANIQESLGIADDDSDVAVNPAPETVGSQGDGTAGSDSPQTTDPTAPDEGDVAMAEPTSEPTAEPTSEPTLGSGDNQLDPTEGVGGATETLPETGEAETQQDPTAPIETIAPTQEPVQPTAEPTLEPTPEPTVEPTAEPTVEPTPEPTVEPTPEPTAEPTAEPTVEPTVEPTAEPTVEPTAAPTEAPVKTPAPTTEPTVEVTAEPTEETQAPSVAPETTPQQAVVADGFRYTIEGAAVGATVPELPQINSVEGYGQWVVLNVYAQNMSSDVQVFDMSRFTLIVDGQEVPLDSGTAWVNGLVGNVPAYGPTDAIQWAPGEAHEVTLTFLAPPTASSLVLQAGDQRIDISTALQNPAPLTSDGQRIESELLQGTVVEVIDGETIVVEIDGQQQTVRYVGLDVPSGDDCYAGEATEANRALVNGQTVMIERQATDTDARGNWVRDVWVVNDAGQPVLVSQQLVAQGAAEASISEPNTRFAGWLQQTQADAQASGAGLWGACSG